MTQAEFRQIRDAARSILTRDHHAKDISRERVVDVVSRVAPVLEARIRAEVVESVLADVHGMGMIDELLKDSDITDVMVVGGRGVWIERGGVLRRVDVDVSAHEVERLIERVVSPLGLHIDRASPMVDARLTDGSRVHAVLPPIAVEGPCLTIRRFGAKHIPLESLAPEPVAALLRQLVTDGCNIVISGGTGAGKTTLLNALTAQLSPHERIITIEDTAELRIPLRHVIRLEARPPNAEGAGEVTVRQLIRTALRMRPDRLIVGEVRGEEALDMLQAMNTGHRGSLSTCHANNARGALSRLETMALMASVATDAEVVRRQIATAVDVVVHMERTPRGRMVVEVVAVREENGRLTTAPLVATS